MTRYLNEELYCELRLRFSLKFRAQKIELLGSRERVSVNKEIAKKCERTGNQFLLSCLQNGGPVVRIKLWLRNSYNSFERKVIFLIMLF